MPIIQAKPPRTMVRVATVIDSFKAVINKGSDDGIALGDEFLFFSLGDDVVDPETGVSLGRLEVLRGRGSVIHVQEKIATVRSTRRRALYDSSSNLLLGLGPRQPSAYEDLPFEGISDRDYGRPV